MFRRKLELEIGVELTKKDGVRMKEEWIIAVGEHVGEVTGFQLMKFSGH